MRKFLFILAILLVFLAICERPKAQTPVTISPVAKQRFSDANGDPLDGGKVFTYASGTSTPLATYTDSTGVSQNTNPIILDSSGYTPNALFLASTSCYKFILKNSAGVTQWTVDGICPNVLLTSNNTWTGTQIFNGTVTFNAAVTANSTVNVKNLNGIPHCEKYGTPGVTPFQTLMAACVAALGGPGVVDATNITDFTNKTMTGNWTISTSGVTVLFGKYTVTMNTYQIVVPSPISNVRFIGSTPYAGTPATCANGTCFKSVGSAGAAVLAFGDASATSYGIVVEDVYLDLTGATNAVGLDLVRVYGAEINRVRGACSVAANINTFILLNGTSTAPGGQSITVRNPVESNCQFGIVSTGGVSPPLCNNTQYIGGQFSGNSNPGSIAIDIQCGNDHEFYGPYIAGYDIGLKVAAASGAAVFGKIHMESCVTYGILMTAAANNNDIWTDTGCTISDLGSQNTFHDPVYVTGKNYIYGSLRTLGTTALNVFDAGLNIKGGTAGLPAATPGGQGAYIVGAIGSPTAIRIYCGDGTGYQCEFAKRTGSADTLVATITELGKVSGTAFGTLTNCASAAAPAVCGAAAAGHVVIAAAATTVIVNTTAVTANSEIMLTRDDSLGSLLSVTCNTQSSVTLGMPHVSARVAGTSFTITGDVAPTTDPECLHYIIVN